MTTITEDYVSFEIAKLLKEKGFDEPCQAYWRDFENGDRVNTTFAPNENHNEAKGFTSMPTHQMAMKWLREVHNLFVFPFPQMNTNKFWVEIFQLSDNQEWENLYCESIDLKDYSTYEEACDAGIKYCLKNLI